MANCGYRTGVIRDASRSNWQNDASRPIAWSAWYPTSETEGANRPIANFFDMGNVVQDAALADQHRYPVVLLSHGTGGTAESLGWLARDLASRGYVVLGANHHGNSGLEPYFAEGFLCWWERATDLSVLLTTQEQNGILAGRLDVERVSAVGFSLGGHTVLTLAGGRSSLAEFDAWRHKHGVAAGGPKEFPDAADHIPELLKRSEAFRKSWARHGDVFADDRVKTVVAIAPAPPIRSFLPATIRQIRQPVTILTGGADQEAPSEHCAHWLMELNTRIQRQDLGQRVGHYTFLEYPSDRSLMGKIDIFTDNAQVDRAQIHRQTADIVANCLA